MWKEENNALHKTYEFKSFVAAIAFMVNAAMHIEELNHHPEWTNVYKKVMVKLSTHDAGNTVTEKDHELARLLDGIYGEVSSK
jgi:4a-hydroxytetrahydrobiopterin dehydratase